MPALIGVGLVSMLARRSMEAHPLFSQTTEYALRVMAWLALSPDVLVPTVNLAEKTRVPLHYLAKVLQQLASQELVKGRRGVRGGYRLARPAKEITLLQVVRAVSSVERFPACDMEASESGEVLCPLHRSMDEAMRLVIEVLDARTLEDLATESDGKPLCASRAPSARSVVMASGNE